VAILRVFVAKKVGEVSSCVWSRFRRVVVWHLEGVRPRVRIRNHALAFDSLL